jgi:phosphoglycolate phosphatase
MRIVDPEAYSYHPEVLAVFDLDGTLIDSRRDLADAANALIVERGGAPLPVDRIAGMVGEGAATLVRRALTAASLDHDNGPDAVARFLALYDERLLAHTGLYDGVDELLRDLSSRAALAVLTNKPVRAAREILEGLGIASRFQWVLGGDGPHPRKPAPAGLLQIAASARAPIEQTVMIGESPIDLATARAAGCAVCLAKYGFGYRSDLPLRGDELIADSPRDIATLLHPD